MENSSINVLPTIFQNYVTVTENQGNEVVIALYSEAGTEAFKSESFFYSTQLNLTSLEPGSYTYMVRDLKMDQLLKVGRIIKE